MRYGCCLNMVASGADGTGTEHLKELAEAEYDYVELPLAEMMALGEEEFARIKEQIQDAGVPCEVCNNLFPKTMRLTGDHAETEAAIVYAEKALRKAKSLGVSVVVFGSGPAKHVPDGFSLEAGRRQVVELLKEISLYAAQQQITLVIEPLRKAECNLINTFAEGCRLAEDVDREQVKVLVDYYHMTVEGEAPVVVADLGGQYLRHVHFANPNGRIYPKDMSESPYAEFFAALEKAGYNGRISCEAYSKDFAADAKKALEMFRRNI